MHRLALILVLASACAADGGDEGFNIVNNLSPGANCVLSGGSGFLARGIIDKQSTSPYIFTPEISSRISAAEGTEAQRTIVLRGANVEVINAETNTSLGKFKSLFAASLPPMGSTTAAFDIIRLEDLAASGAQGTKRVQLLAKITPFGALGGSGDNIDGVTFQYPVTVCDGCVAQVLGTCPLPSTVTIPADTPNGCNQFQDGVVHCCMGATGLVCPPTTVEQFTLTVMKAGANGPTATVTSNPAGINCDPANTACIATYNAGTTVVLTVTGGATVTWTGAAGCTTGVSCTTQMTAAKTVTVTIAP